MDTTVRIEKKEPGDKDNTNGESADSLLRQAATSSPEVIAFADPPNRADFGIGPAQRVTFAEADALATRVAAGFADHGLEAGDTIAFQLPNTWESALIMIAAWRARLIAVPMPMMWRLNELHHAVAQIDPKAIITVGRFAGHDHAATMREAAAQHISVRYIFGLGAELCDGITPINDWLESDPRGEADVQTVRAGSANDVALMTWAASTSGVHPVPRTHAELLAVGRVAVAALQLTNADVLLNAYPLTGIAAVAGQLIAAMLTSAPLNFHLPFDYDTFVTQLREERVSYTAVPAPVIAALAERGDMAEPGLALTRIGCVRTLPSDLESGDALAGFPVPVYTIHNLAELALIIACENADQPAALPLGELFATDTGTHGEGYLETRVRGSVAGNDAGQRLEGELFVRGPTVPGGGLDRAGALTQMLLLKDAQGYLNTRIPCYIDDTMEGNFRCRRNSELLYHGGVAVPAAELDKTYAEYPEFLDAAA
ncbi:MAG: acyl--CoA ligase, partial [Hyphomicrobiales bacterium]|nr:acyl--CoA ligase [Hyphomicrobiales bacterium]